MTSEKRERKFNTDDASPDLGSASDWLNQISHAARPIRSTTQIWVVTCNQYELVWNFCARFSDVIWRETTDSVTICRLFPQATALSVNYQLRVSFDSAS